MILGRRSTKIFEVYINNTECQYCGNMGVQQVSVFGKYFHAYWIPLFPIGRKIVSECGLCKKTILQNAFSQRFNDQIELRKDQIKTPLWHWSGLVILSVFLSLLFLLS